MRKKSIKFTNLYVNFINVHFYKCAWTPLFMHLNLVKLHLNKSREKFDEKRRKKNEEQKAMENAQNLMKFSIFEQLRKVGLLDF